MAAHLLTLAVASTAGCDTTRLSRMPNYTHEPWCKVLERCDLVGGALLATAVNCTTRNTVHLPMADGTVLSIPDNIEEDLAFQ